MGTLLAKSNTLSKVALNQFVTVVFLITGFGITEFRTVETLTFGWLTKGLALKIHNSLWLPFIILLVLHICLPFFFKWRRRGVKP